MYESANKPDPTVADCARLFDIFKEAAKKQARFNLPSISLVPLPEHSSIRFFQYGQLDNTTTVLIDEYCDYVELTDPYDRLYLEDTAKKLGFAVGSFFNGLVANVYNKHNGRIYVIDPFTENNLRFHCLHNDAVALCPGSKPKGWMSWRLKFAAAPWQKPA